MFDKSVQRFPSKGQVVSFCHCGVSPLYGGAVEDQHSLAQALSTFGTKAIRRHGEAVGRFRESAAHLLRVEPKNISFVPNTAYGINIAAHGLRLSRGDEIISYRAEYPSNHYPWRLQERRGVALRLLEGDQFEGKPLRWRFEELEQLVTRRTRVVAVSHVQFTSGATCDLKRLGEFCRVRDIVLVVDAAQSVGCLPVFPEECGIDCLVTSGWKWLLGPLGTGILYTSPRFRAAIDDVWIGPDCMTQGSDYLDHTYSTFEDGRRFEISTAASTVVAGLARALADIPVRYGIESVSSEIFRLQELFLSGLDAEYFVQAPLTPAERSGILSFHTTVNAEQIASLLSEKNILASVRGGYLRFAPHFYHDDRELIRAAEAANDAAWQVRQQNGGAEQSQIRVAYVRGGASTPTQPAPKPEIGNREIDQHVTAAIAE